MDWMAAAFVCAADWTDCSIFPALGLSDIVCTVRDQISKIIDNR